MKWTGAVEVLAGWFLWLKAFHVISAIAWMAGLFYLPRLYVYHCMWKFGDGASDMLEVMERRLVKAIMRPAGIATWVFGILAGLAGGYFSVLAWWFVLKLALVAAMTVFHGLLEMHGAAFAGGRNRHSGRYFRIINEVPTVLLIFIVILVVVQPGG